MNVKQAVVIFADGYEEVEALCVVDLLRRAGVKVSMLALNGEREVTGSHGITFVMDGAFDEIKADEIDAIVLPGGLPGTTNLRNSEELKNFVLKMDEQQKIVSAICAAPTVLNDAGICKGKRVTSYPSFKEEFTESEYLLEAVVEDGNMVTSRGVGTALDFALVLIKKMISDEKAREIKTSIIY